MTMDFNVIACVGKHLCRVYQLQGLKCVLVGGSVCANPT